MERYFLFLFPQTHIMNSKLSIYSLLVLSSILLFSLQCTDQNSSLIKPSTPHPLIGSWGINSVHWMTKDTMYSINEAQPGILMIDSLRYAIIWTPTEGPRTPFKKLSNPTDEEIKAGFSSIIFNTGSYELTDSTLNTKAIIAKMPGFESGQQFYRYTLKQDQLELTMFDETYPNGDKPNWYGIYETKFMLSRIK